MAGRYLDLASADSKLNVLSRTRFMQDHNIFKQNYFRLWLHNRIYCSHHYNLSQVLDQPMSETVSVKSSSSAGINSIHHTFLVLQANVVSIE